MISRHPVSRYLQIDELASGGNLLKIFTDERRDDDWCS